MTKYVKYILIILLICILIILWCQSMQDKNVQTNLKGKIVFSVGRDDLYVLDLPSQEVNKINLKKFHIYFPSYPCWLSDDKIVFTNYRDNRGIITIYDLERKGVIEYPEINLDCSFISVSPSGKEIAFLGRTVGSEKQIYKLYTLSLDSKKFNLVSDVPVGPYKPSWSPDARKVAFTSVDNKIYSLSDDKTELIISNGVAPAWSPKGNKILYRSTYFVYLYDLDNNLKNSVITNFGFNDVKEYAWSPDAKYIVYKKFTESHSPLVVKGVPENTKITLRKFGNVKGLCWKY
ncbi:MAG: hypothetical protein K0A93_12345 [Desulfuromonadaceae bacterium]|nr:hypothetical protein [Desulfuromonadaceae bacterium]